MTEENKSYESKLTEKQYALVDLEIRLNELSSMLGDVTDDSFSGHESSVYPTLRKEYMRVLMKTKNLNPGFDYIPQKIDSQTQICKKIEDYINFLQTKGIYSFGKEDFRL